MWADARTLLRVAKSHWGEDSSLAQRSNVLLGYVLAKRRAALGSTLQERREANVQW